MATLRPRRSTPGDTASLVSDLQSWWQSDNADWDAAVDGALPHLPGGADLWDDMPAVDSKAVARSAPIFEEHLGIKLDVTLIRKGGYAGINEMINDLVPKMSQVAARARNQN